MVLRACVNTIFLLVIFISAKTQDMANSKKSILLLHGAIGAAQQMQPLKTLLAEQYEVHTLSFSGHGGEAMPEGGFSIPLFAQDVLAYMESVGLVQTIIFGYSMGGYVAMYMARHYPDKVSQVITLGTKYSWDEPTAAKEIKMLNADKLEEKLPAFAATLKARHLPNDWKEVVTRTADMLWQLGQNNVLSKQDYQLVHCPCCIMRGSDDSMVTKEEGVFVKECLQQAYLLELEATPHPIEKVLPTMIKEQIDAFLET